MDQLSKLYVGGLQVNVSLSDLIIKNIIFETSVVLIEEYIVVKESVKHIHEEVYLVIFIDLRCSSPIMISIERVLCRTFFSVDPNLLYKGP